MEYPHIIYEKSPPLAIISLNRPETRNAFTLLMTDSICRALEDARNDGHIKVIILRGRGEAFSAGGNIKDMANGRLAAWDMKDYLWENVQRVPLLLDELDKPVIASIDGPAYGGGFDLALACDFRIASRQATFCSTFVRIGLAPGAGGAYFLTRVVGLNKALDILLTGREIEADEALRIGLADRVAPPGQLAHETRAFAMEIARGPLASLRAIKRAVYDGLKSDLRGHLDYMSSQLALLSQTQEHRVAIRRLLKKEGRPHDPSKRE